MFFRNICVIGGGNIGTYVSVTAKNKGYNVSLFVRNASSFEKKLTVSDGDVNQSFSAELDCITSDVAVALKDADVVFITYPSFLFSKLDELIYPFVSEKTSLCFLPGSGGAEFAFSNCLQKGVRLFGLQRVPVVARLETYGKTVHVSGKKRNLFLGAINSSAEDKESFQSFISSLFEIETVLLPNYLCVTLTPSNPILHTTRLYSMFKDYSDGIVYPHNPLFYEEWTDDSSHFLFECDKELQTICRAIKDLELTSVVSLPVYYESPTEQALTRKITSIPAFKGIRSPVKERGAGFVPDFSSRYFTADFPFGLRILIEIGKLFQIETPVMNTVWEWYEKVSGVDSENIFKLNISKEEFIKLYKEV